MLRKGHRKFKRHRKTGHLAMPKSSSFRHRRRSKKARQPVARPFRHFLEMTNPSESHPLAPDDNNSEFEDAQDPDCYNRAGERDAQGSFDDEGDEGWNVAASDVHCTALDDNDESSRTLTREVGTASQRPDGLNGEPPGFLGTEDHQRIPIYPSNLINDRVEMSLASPRHRMNTPFWQSSYIVTSSAPSVPRSSYHLVPSPSRALTRRPIPGTNVIEPSSALPSAFFSAHTAAHGLPDAGNLPLRPTELYARPQNATTTTVSSASTRGRRTSWWVTECFMDRFDSNGRTCKVCLHCKSQSFVTSRDGKVNASRLAEHLWKCPKVNEEIRKRLYKDSCRIQNNVRRYSRGLDGVDGERFDDGEVVRPLKRRRCLDTGQKNTNDCTTAEEERFLNLLLRTVVAFNLPFTLFDSSKSDPNPFRSIFGYVSPRFEARFPMRHRLLTKALPKMYSETNDVVKRYIHQMLKNGYGTVIFDGWDDVTQSSVVNVLIRIESRSERKTFFLDSVYTGHTRLCAGEYVKIVENVMQEFGGLNRICGVASDSAKACVNARKALAKKYPGVIGIQDQAHVADLLMKDLGKLPFIKVIIDKVNLIVSETRGKRKLLSFVRGEVSASNKRIRQEDRNSRRNDTQTPTDPFHPSRLFPPLRRTAVMLRRPATTRFASISDTLEAFIRTRDVLGKVIMDPQFERNLFTADKPEQEERREEYKEIISSPQFLEQVKDVHKIFRLCRRYLREFDKETDTTVSDVVAFTDFLEKALDHVPSSDAFLTRERMSLIKSRFKRRKDGPITGRGIQVRLVEDIHVAAALLHPTKCPRDYQSYQQRFYAFVKRWVTFAVLPSAVADDEGDESSDDEDSLDNSTIPSAAPREDRSELRMARNGMVSKIMNDYEAVHSRWMRMVIPESTEGSENNGGYLRDEFAYRSSPLRFWNEELRVGNCPELCELALRTLSISPSSCAAERSFSVQGRMVTKTRNRLRSDIVRKLMFLRWNIGHYDQSRQGGAARSSIQRAGTSTQGESDSEIDGDSSTEEEEEEEGSDSDEVSD